MAPPSKATAEQKDFLEQNISAYREAQKHGAFQKLWPQVFKGWFDRWPETEDMTIENEELRKKVYKGAIKRTWEYIKVWFRNHGVENTRCTKEVSVKPLKPTRSLQLMEYYSKKHYNERIATNVATALAAFGDKTISTSDCLAIIRDQTTKAFQLETPQFRKKFIEEHKKYQEVFAAERLKEKDTESEFDPTPASYQSGIATIRAYFEQFAVQTAASGWSFVLLGGPDPQDGGKIRTSAFHHGSNLLGLSISDYDPNFRQHHLPAFARFLTGCYTSEECDARALPMNDSVNTALSASPPLYVMSPSPTRETTPVTPPLPIPPAPIPAQTATLPNVAEHAAPIVPATPIPLTQMATLPIAAEEAPLAVPIAAEHAALANPTEFSWDGFDLPFSLNGGFLGGTTANFMPSINAQFGAYPSLSAELQASLAPDFDITNFGVGSATEMMPTPPSIGLPPCPGLSSLAAPLLMLPTQSHDMPEAGLRAMDAAIPMPPVPANEAVLPASIPANEAVLPASIPASEAALPVPLVPSPTEMVAAAPAAQSTALAPLPVNTTGRKRCHDEVDTRFIVTTKRAKIPKKRVEVEALTANRLKGKENRVQPPSQAGVVKLSAGTDYDDMGLQEAITKFSQCYRAMG
ncbi:hypothetical protein PLEOSDRAFT_171715 [Pleurotus ostreatus PC15]|uniref:Uncharacterized protein n=1 Tax=Pleurotus ostreatus (strain PC15) TaxID=1137138 RepID=A0A067NDX4_PLEO1|nr:hypothetical protein PLEOSDRAFT_171715 [Pleurotus ostreatus PC15]